MVSSPRSRATARPTGNGAGTSVRKAAAKTASKPRAPAKAMRGLVKVARPKESLKRAVARTTAKGKAKTPAKAKSAKTPARSKAKTASAARKAAPATRTTRRAAVAKAAQPAPPPKPEKPTAEQIARDKELARQHAVTGVTRAMDLLEALGRTGPVPLAILAETAKIGKTTTLALLTAMQVRNFVVQDETHGLWRLGARWSVMGQAASEQGALAATAMPHLSALGNATGENVYLRVRDGMECETVAIYQTDSALRVYTDVGQKMPLHAGSGRVLLAHAPEAVQTQVLAQRLQRYTPSTRIDPTWIAADLHRIRQRGFLITDSEVVPGTISVCAPVRDASGQVVAALLIGAPSLRMRPPRPRALMPLVVEAALKLSQALGAATDEPVAAAEPVPATSRKPAEMAGPAWPASASLTPTGTSPRIGTAALSAPIARPHTIFRPV